jgi:hypothetical protein
VATGDLDGDGDQDLVIASNPVMWYENLGSGAFGPEHVLGVFPVGKIGSGNK